MVAAIGEVALAGGGRAPAAAIEAALISQDAADFLAAQAEAEIAIIAEPIGRGCAAIAEVGRQHQRAGGRGQGVDRDAQAIARGQVAGQVGRQDAE